MKKLSFGQFINSILLILMALCTLYPFWYVFCVSLSTYKDVINKKLVLWPVNFTMENINYIIKTPDFINIYGNTTFLVIAGTFLSLACTILFSYSLARNVPGNSWISYAVFFTLLFGGGMIPTYLVVRSTGLLNSLWALIIPRLIDPFNIFLMRNFFKSIPDSIDESASIDGAGVFTILFKIILPISIPGIATIGLFYAVGYWNSFFDAIIYISTRQKWTLQVLLREILVTMQPDILGSAASNSSNDSLSQTMSYATKMATIVTAVVPVMCIYPFVQRYFVKGVMVGAVKG